VLLTDGPFAEAKDQIGGFSLIECGSVEEAIEIAAKHPVARYGSIEIRRGHPAVRPPPPKSDRAAAGLAAVCAASGAAGRTGGQTKYRRKGQ
jgi:hypothetical protein